MGIPKKDFELDLWKQPINILHLVQYESAGRDVQFRLLDDGRPYDVTGKTVLLEMQKPDRNIVVMSCDIVSAAEGIIKATIVSQAVVVAGEAIAQFRVSAEGQKSKSFAQRVLIAESINADEVAESTTEFTALQDLIVDVQSWENKIDELDDRVSQIITTPAESVTAQEIIDARDGETALGDRLDRMEAGGLDAPSGLVLTNLVTNGDFASNVAGWSTTNSALTWDDGAAKLVGNGAASNQTLTQNIASTTVVGNRYYHRNKVLLDNDAFQSYRFYIGSVLQYTSVPFPPNIWKTISGIIVATAAQKVIYPYVNYPNGIAQNGKTMLIDDVVVIDLTAAFGADIPPKDEIDLLIDILGGYIDGTHVVTVREYLAWQQALIRQNRNAIIALGGTIL